VSDPIPITIPAEAVEELVERVTEAVFERLGREGSPGSLPP